MLDPIPEDIQPSRIQGILETDRLGRSLDVRGETGSTMDDARAVVETAPDGHVVLADRQTRGRGAHGRDWESPGATDVYFSFVDRSPVPGEARPLITLATGLGVADAAEELSGVHARIKWPNDVWLGDRKCAGVLVETSTRGNASEAMIIGVGLNVNRRSWPKELEGIAVSLAQARKDGVEVDRGQAVAHCLQAIERWLDRLATQGPAPVVDALGRRLALLGEEVCIDGTCGVLEGVSERGAARLRTAEGHQDVVAGTLRRA